MKNDPGFRVISDLEKHDSRINKENIIETQAKNGNDEFFAGVRLAYDTRITFGVKQIPEKLVQGGSGLAWADFNAVASKLIDRTLSGNAARNAVNDLMEQATTAEWNGWYRRILLKDMKAGFSESTINRVCKKLFPQYTINVFECQLAKDCVDEDGNVDESELHGKKIIDTKLDGMRVITIVFPNGSVQQFTRNGQEIFNFTVIRDQISRAALASNLEEAVVLDAEVMSKSFQDLMKQARRKTDVQADDSILNVFDLMTLKEFKEGKSKFKQIQRLTMLHRWHAKHAETMPNVNVLGYEIVDLDTMSGRDRLMEINKLALASKAEGIMLKDPDAVYECKRSKNWLKMKPFIEESLTVIDVEEGKPDSKFVGTLGALVCQGVVDGKMVRVHVGGGYSIKLRAQLWAKHTGKPVIWKKKEASRWVEYTEMPDGAPIVGMIAEVRADGLTKPQTGEIWSMRFPRFKTFRGFVPGEKI